MSNYVCFLNLDKELSSKKLAFILNKFDDFCENLSSLYDDFNSLKICIHSPKSSRTYEKHLHSEDSIFDEYDDPCDEEEFWVDDDEDFMDEDSDWENGELDDSDCNCFDETDEPYLHTNKPWRN